MSDFLTSLVQRNAGPPVGVRPRVASLFEPVHQPGAPSIDLLDAADGGRAVEDVVEAEPPEHKENAAPARRRRVDRPVPAAKSLPPETGEPSIARPAADVPPRVQESLRPVAKIEEVRDTVRRVDRVETAEQAPEPAPARARTAAATGEMSREKLPAAPPQSAVPVEPRLLIPPPIAVGIAADMERAASAWERSSPPTGEIRETRDASRDVAEPDIHVTIGRIDVRAVPEGKAAARPRAASPVMGLDEYLRQQARRGVR